LYVPLEQQTTYHRYDKLSIVDVSSPAGPESLSLQALEKPWWIMNKQSNKKSPPVAGSLTRQQRVVGLAIHSMDNRPGAAIQRKLQETVNNSRRLQQSTPNNSASNKSAVPTRTLPPAPPSAAVGSYRAAIGLQKKPSGPPVIQRMSSSGFSFGADSGADNVGSFYLDDQRREAEARRAAARRYRQEVDAARRLITGNIQLSANKPAVLREFERLISLGGQGAPSAVAYMAMANVLQTISGSDNADREQHGGALGYSRR
jgi:hypothetical protein